MKLADMCSHGVFGIGSDWRRPAGARLVPLNLWHVSHLAT